MASPFSFFRKHQAGMMVVLVILAMLVFTLDALFTQSGANFWLLGLLLGGAVFGVAGVGSGQWLQWGVGGAILGALLGLALPEFTGPPPVLAAKSFLVEREELEEMGIRRAVANQFMYRAMEEAHGEGMGRFSRQFGFGHPPTEDVLFGRLLTEEAKDLGVAVTDAMVVDFINKATADKLSVEGFATARKSLNYQQKSVPEDLLFSILKEQLAREIAYKALAPMGSISPPSPEIMWQYFRRLNVRQAINVTELDVDAFVDQIDDPTDAEVEELFATGRDKVQNADDPGSPGFMQQVKAKVAWLETSFEAVEADVSAVSDEDVEAFYNDNRETRYRRVKIPDTELESDPADGTPSDAEDAESESAEDDAAAGEETPVKDDAPADPAEDAADSEGPTESETPAEPEAPEAPEATEEAAEESAAADGAQFSIDDPEATDDGEAAGESENAEAVSDDGEDAANDLAPLQIPDNPLPLLPEQPADAEIVPGSGMPMEFEYTELTDELRESIREEIHANRVREEIDARMNKAITFLQGIASERRKVSSEFMQQGQSKYAEDPDGAALDLRNEVSPLTSGYLQRMREYAEENGLVYADTGERVTFAEFRDEDDFPLGASRDPAQPRFQATGQSEVTAFSMFSSFSRDDVAANDTSIFIPGRAVYESFSDEGTETHYAYWAVDVLEAHVPTLDEPGIRADVIMTWKRMKARDLVKTRAEELAEKIRTGLAKAGEERVSMAASLEGETLTGKEGSATLLVRESQPFAWLRQSVAPATSFQQRPQVELSRIRFGDGLSILEMAGDEFMKTVFEEMDNDDVGIVPNADRSGWFVVQVINRSPSKEIGMEALRERFAQEGQLNFAGSPLGSLIQREIVGPAMTEWERALWKKHDLDPEVILLSLQESGR